ncbi:MAG TPA: CCA tRNA nucleotidyltransferase [Candidatus Thermoplasmatota archaeon]|nr:CCA tRNA nucleotidyltransferase [Candidatus Thermoplasmatota archaeon]
MPAPDTARTTLEVGILEAVRPPPAEEAKMARIAADLVARCRAAAEFFGARAEPKVVGSFEKKTQLKGADLDVFLLFSVDTPLEALKELGVKIAKSVIDEGETRYAEHPYLRGRIEGVRVDVVPAYKVASAAEMRTAVDRTPFHNEFVRERLAPSQRDEVRLLKAFLRGVGAYGSELRVQGFSGYLCELLVIRFGGFEGVMQAAAGWREGPALSVEGTVPTEVLHTARRDFGEPLVFIDPVDPSRNVASPVSLDKLALFVFAAREYLRDPRPLFFFPNPKRALTPTEIREAAATRGTRILGVTIRGSPEVDDVWIPQLRKSERALSKLLTTYGFTVARSDVQAGADGGEPVLFLFELTASHLPSANKHFGPSALHENARDFVEKWNGRPGQLSKPYVEEGRLMVDVTREFTDAADLLKDRATSVAHGKGVADAFAERFDVIELDDAAREPFTGRTSAFLQPGLPWQF